MSQEPSRIRVRPQDGAFFSALTALALGGALYFHWRGSLSGTLACGAAALLLVFTGLLLMGSAACPRCAGPLTGLSPAGLRPYARCPRCRRYARCEAGRVSELDGGHVAAAPAFAVPVDAVERLPQECCVCLAPSTRAQELAYTAAVRHMPGFPTGKPMKFKASAPYCDAHHGEATLTFEDLAPYPGFSAEMLVESVEADAHFVLTVRSYGFYLKSLGLG